MARSALELEVSIPTIDAAVGTLALPARERQRALLATPSRQPAGRCADEPRSVLAELHGALQAAMIITYAQGLALLAAASKLHGFHYQLDDLCRAWRGCAPLRTALLEDMAAALETTPDLPDLLSDEDLSEKVMARQECLRRAVWRAHQLDILTPALLASLDYLDSNRRAWLPFNLIQVPPRPPAQVRHLAVFSPTSAALESFAGAPARTAAAGPDCGGFAVRGNRATAGASPGGTRAQLDLLHPEGSADAVDLPTSWLIGLPEQLRTAHLIYGFWYKPSLAT